MEKTRSKNTLRPTSSLVKNALFNILGNISGKEFLDLFCGTGQIGMEAEKRGAKVVYVDISRKNIDRLKGKVKGKLVKSDAINFLKKYKGNFDIIFADPPYGYEYYDKLIYFCLDKLKSDGIFILEHDKRIKFDADNTRQYGDTVLSFWIKDE